MSAPARRFARLTRRERREFLARPPRLHPCFVQKAEREVETG